MSGFLRDLVLIVLVLVLLALQLVLNRYVSWLSMLDLPLIAVLYLTLSKESLVWTVLSGTGVGFLQDSLSLGAMGMNGFTKISVSFLAYLANSVFAIDRLAARWIMLFLASVVATLMLFLLRVLFLNREEVVDVKQLLTMGLVNACLGLAIFYLFDRMTRDSND